MLVPLIDEHYKHHRLRMLKRISFRVPTIEEAEDILQEAYYRALKYSHSYDGNNLEAWLGMIIRNCLRDSRNMYVASEMDEFIEEEAEGTDCPTYPEHVMRDVFKMIEEKPFTQREILTMYFKYEYAAIDISRITNHSYAQCHKTISRFRQELAEIYK